MRLLQDLPPEKLAQVNEALVDALISSARGEPSFFAINELVHISQDEAQRLCRKIGLDWSSGRFSDQPGEADPAPEED
ncbi:MAG: hypothetical protein HJJLKODD_01088 [Phycisphaerae bacterium]|nr:hypothetical protein [Phycisphaerae bacterium]